LSSNRFDSIWFNSNSNSTSFQQYFNSFVEWENISFEQFTNFSLFLSLHFYLILCGLQLTVEMNDATKETERMKEAIKKLAPPVVQNILNIFLKDLRACESFFHIFNINKEYQIISAIISLFIICHSHSLYFQLQFVICCFLFLSVGWGVIDVVCDECWNFNGSSINN
jgi:hypothetical protein